MARSIEDLKAKLAEKEAVKALHGDWLTNIIKWTQANPPPSLEMRCEKCGKLSYLPYNLSWQDIEDELARGNDPLRERAGICPKCSDAEEEEDDEDDD